MEAWAASSSCRRIERSLGGVGISLNADRITNDNAQRRTNKDLKAKKTIKNRNRHINYLSYRMRNTKYNLLQLVMTGIKNGKSC